PARVAKFASRMHTRAGLWREWLALLQAESDPEEMQGGFPPGLDASDVLRGARLLAKNRYRSWAHAPRANYSGRVTILGATNPQRLQGWNAYCARGVEIRSYPVQGGRVLSPHFAMFNASNVAL